MYMSSPLIAPADTPNAPPTLTHAQMLNEFCACQTLYPEQLRTHLETDASLAGLTAVLAQTHPNLFSPTAVFLDSTELADISATVTALDGLMRSAAWQRYAMRDVAKEMQTDFGPTGAFMGYDFHLSDTGAKLIEINTNAGGAFLNAVLTDAHYACCDAMHLLVGSRKSATLTQSEFTAMFNNEWRLQRGDAHLTTIVITDDEPDSQFLAPEFQLAKLMFERAGFRVAVGDASEFSLIEGRLYHPALSAVPIDMVYNRLTDFMLDEPSHSVLRAAYLHNAAVLTPNPHNYALHANKSHLATLSDSHALQDMQISPDVLARILHAVPRTVPVSEQSADTLWAERRNWFFKPVIGFGSRAAYRGDKLTRRVWDSILQGDYVAQRIVTPSERLVTVDGESKKLKVDIRAYAYQGQVQLLAARTWQGQTTNFRTHGGGFSPVLILTDTGSNFATSSDLR